VTGDRSGAGPRTIPFALGIDVGGTFTKLAVLGAGEQVLAEGRIATEAAAGPEQLVSRVAAAARELAAGAGLDLARARAAGVGIAGLVERATGVLAACPNLPGFEGFQVARAFGRALALPIQVENDANACALAEARLGAGRGRDPVALLTLGTGVGGAFVVGGQILHGAAGFAGEFGHMALSIDDGPRCACGQRGCVEAYLRSSHVVALALEHAARGNPTAGPQLARALASGEATARLVGEAAQAGDPVAVAVFSELGRALGMAIANLISVLNPAVVILGGGVALAGEVLLSSARATALARVIPPLARDIAILPAALGDRGGVLGAALLAFEAVDPLRIETGAR
jgi:glucokinase